MTRYINILLFNPTVRLKINNAARNRFFTSDLQLASKERSIGWMESTRYKWKWIVRFVIARTYQILIIAIAAPFVVHQIQFFKPVPSCYQLLRQISQGVIR